MTRPKYAPVQYIITISREYVRMLFDLKLLSINDKEFSFDERGIPYKICGIPTIRYGANRNDIRKK
jgi:hypothetical protein